MQRRKILLVVLAMGLSGCDTLYGVYSDAELQGNFDPTCVDRSLRSVSGVKAVRFLPLSSPDKTIFAAILNMWHYEAGGSVAILQVSRVKKRLYYTNGLDCLNCRIPTAKMNAYEPVMKKVNATVAATCGLLLRGIKERYVE